MDWSVGFIVCMSLWLVFMLIWVYFGPIKREWFRSLPYPFLAVICSLVGLILH